MSHYIIMIGAYSGHYSVTIILIVDIAESCYCAYSLLL